MNDANAPVTGKKLLFVTGTRADFGKLEPLAHAAQQAGFEISFFITGMHMMKRYGETRLEVKRFAGAEFFEFVNQREGDALRCQRKGRGDAGEGVGTQLLDSHGGVCSIKRLRRSDRKGAMLQAQCQRPGWSVAAVLVGLVSQASN